MSFPLWGLKKSPHNVEITLTVGTQMPKSLRFQSLRLSPPPHSTAELADGAKAHKDPPDMNQRADHPRRCGKER